MSEQEIIKSSYYLTSKQLVEISGKSESELLDILTRHLKRDREIQALSMSGVVGRSESVFCNCDLPALIGNSVTQEVICVKCKRPKKN